MKSQGYMEIGLCISVILLLVEILSTLEWTCGRCGHSHSSGGVSSSFESIIHEIRCAWGEGDDV